eukprot:2564470-Rhodomonas_salina.5
MSLDVIPALSSLTCSSHSPVISHPPDFLSPDLLRALPCHAPPFILGILLTLFNNWWDRDYVPAHRWLRTARDQATGHAGLLAHR